MSNSFEAFDASEAENKRYLAPCRSLPANSCRECVNETTKAQLCSCMNMSNCIAAKSEEDLSCQSIPPFCHNFDSDCLCPPQPHIQHVVAESFAPALSAVSDAIPYLKDHLLPELCVRREERNFVLHTWLRDNSISLSVALHYENHSVVLGVLFLKTPVCKWVRIRDTEYF